MSLSAVFARLTSQAAGLPSNAYIVETAPAAQETYVAASNDGRPAFFIAVARQGDSPGIRLRNLELRHGTQGDLRTAQGQSVTGTYTLVECKSHDARLHQAFLELASEVLTRATPWQDTLELERGFTSMVELFQAVSLPSPSSWMGAWGELFLMHRSPRPEDLLACWHVDPLKLHDFSLGAYRLECKTTGGQTRSHEFSLRQLDEAERTIYVASIVTHENLSGVSALTLYDELRGRIRHAELRVHLDNVMIRMLGDSLDSPSAPRFDYEEARQNLRIFSATSVPAPINPCPNLVDSVRFQSDLSHCEQTSSQCDLLKLLG
jgi:hypothetical protein